MEGDFWLERWEKEEIGFHQKDFNSYLCQYWHDMNLANNSLVFVPLCGKSRDMVWLKNQGHSVLGVELSPIAVQTFFKENGYFPNQIKSGNFESYEANDIKILCGNYFDLSKDDLNNVSAVYDRASLIAMPPGMRESYVQKLMDVLPPATKILLITAEYPQDEMQGPPFSVDSKQVNALYQEHADIRLVNVLDVLANQPRFQDRGLSRLQENIFLLTLNKK